MISFRMKLTVIITLLTAGFTTLGMVVFYSFTYTMMLDRMGKNLIDVGRLGTVLFDKESRDAIQRLKAATEQGMKLSVDELLAIPLNGSKSSLSPQAIERLQASDDFQRLVEKLRFIAQSSLGDIVPGSEGLNPEKVMQYIDEGVIAPYIGIRIKESPQNDMVKYLVSAAYAPSGDGWPGNPIGNVVHSAVSLDDLFNGEASVVGDLITDEFYTSLSAGIPILDETGKTIAFLGLDYPVGRELEKMKQLTQMSVVIVTVSAVFGFLLSWFVATRMSSPLHLLHDAALQIKNKNYDVRVDVTSTDEFGVLGRVFNRMALAVQTSMIDLQKSNDRLRYVIADIHDGVGSALTRIQIATRKPKNPDMEHVQNLARQGLSEVRFLMDTLEYDNSDFNMLCEDIDILASDILKPQGIQWITKHSQNNIELPFRFYLDIQRIVREALTNTIKHSNADTCEIQLDLSNGRLTLTISDNGQLSHASDKKRKGLGLENMEFRMKPYQGDVSFTKNETGFHLAIDVKVPSDTGPWVSNLN